MWKVQELV